MAGEVHAAYLSLVNQILGQSQVINYQYKRLLAVETFLKELRITFDFSEEETEMLDDLLNSYGLDRTLFIEGDASVQ